MTRASNAALQRPGDNYIVRQVVDERHADSGPLQALVRVALAAAAPTSIITQPFSSNEPFTAPADVQPAARLNEEMTQSPTSRRAER